MSVQSHPSTIFGCTAKTAYVDAAGIKLKLKLKLRFASLAVSFKSFSINSHTGPSE